MLLAGEGLGTEQSPHNSNSRDERFWKVRCLSEKNRGMNSKKDWELNGVKRF